jgi:transcription antitermination factor NusG
VSGYSLSGNWAEGVISPPASLDKPTAEQLGCARQPEWYALLTRCRHEKRVSEQLQQKGICVFLPTYKEQRRWSDRRKVIEVPLFSCYVFVHLVATPAVRLAALQAPGALRFAGFNGTPAPIPPEQIENVQRALARTQGICPFEFVQVGQRVRIRGGALDGVKGVLLGRKDDRRLVVSIDLIQQAMAVVIEGYDVEPA